MKTDRVDSAQQPGTNSHLPGRRPATDRIKTGYGSDNLRSKITDKPFNSKEIEPAAVGNGAENSSTADPLAAGCLPVGCLLPVNWHFRTFRGELATSSSALSASSANSALIPFPPVQDPCAVLKRIGRFVESSYSSSAGNISGFHTTSHKCPSGSWKYPE